jgi:hypothetical protein
MHLQQGVDWVDQAKGTLAAGLCYAVLIYFKNRKKLPGFRSYVLEVITFMAASAAVKLLMSLRM